MDSYYLEEFFTTIYNARIDDRAMSEIFLFLPSRKVKWFFHHLPSSLSRSALSRLLFGSHRTDRPEDDR